MKITEKKLRGIIREAIRGKSVRSGKPFIDTVMASLIAGDAVAAADAVMNSYMIDDVFPEEEQALIDALSAHTYAGASVRKIEAIADAWLQNYRAGKLRP